MEIIGGHGEAACPDAWDQNGRALGMAGAPGGPQEGCGTHPGADQKIRLDTRSETPGEAGGEVVHDLQATGQEAAATGDGRPRC